MELLFEKQELPPMADKKVVAIIARAQPPSQGHYKVIDSAKKFIRQHRELSLDASPVFIVIGGSKSDKDKHRNPLSIEDRIKFMKASGKANGVIFLHAKDAYSGLAMLRSKGMEPLAIAAGSDRIHSYKEILDKNFKAPDGKDITHYAIDVVRSGKSANSTLDSAKSGELDSKDVSGSVARRAVELGFLPEFTKIVGLEDKPELAKQMFDKVKAGISSKIDEAVEDTKLKCYSIHYFSNRLGLAIGNEYTEMDVMFFNDGRISMESSDERAKPFWDKHKEMIINFAKKCIRDHILFTDQDLTKENIIKIILNDYKRGDVAQAKFSIAGSRVLGHDYPEFKDIEKSMRAIKESEDDQPIELYNKQDKIIDFIEVNNTPFFLHMENYPNIEGKITKLNSKKTVLRVILKLIKDGWVPFAKELIQICRNNGYEWHEFNAIEKSLNSGKVQESEDDEIRLYHNGVESGIDLFNGSIAPVFPNADNPNKKIAERPAGHVVHYRSKKEMIRNLLHILSQGNDIINDRIVKNVIKLARENGYDYPEFKAIERSMNSK